MSHLFCMEFILRHQTVSSASFEAGHSQTHSNAPEILSSLEVNASSAAAPNSDQLKPQIMPHIGGWQYPFLHTAPEYSFGLVPPMVGPHVVQLEATEV